MTHMYMYMDCIYHKSGVQCFIVRFNCSLDCSRAAHTLALATIIHALDISLPRTGPASAGPEWGGAGAGV